MLKTTQITQVFFSLFCLAILAGCQNNNAPAGEASGVVEVNRFVYAYTSGVISRGDVIRVRFAQPAVTAGQVGEQAQKGLLSFSPDIDGSANWEDEQTLVFQPEEWLPTGQAYQARVNLTKVIDNVAGEDKDFSFSFKTRDQHLHVSFDGLSVPNANDLRAQQLRGQVNTSDLVDIEAVKSTLSASQNGRALSVNWNNSNGLQHDFVIEGIERSEQASRIQVSWDGKAIGTQDSEDQDFEIPSLSDFKILGVQVNTGEDQYISLQFSDPLLGSQNINGLVALTDYEGTYRFLIDGTELRVYPSNRVAGEHKLLVNPGIRNANDFRMEQPSEWLVGFEGAKPQVRLVGKGVIIPNSNGLVFPFEAIGLRAVELEVFKIYHNNILQFLQTNNLDGFDYQMNRVGRIVLQKKIDLAPLNPSGSTHTWTRYALNLDELIQTDDEAIYQIRLGFRPSYASYQCGSSAEDEDENMTVVHSNLDDYGEIQSIMGGWYGIEGYYEDYEYSHREDPCFPAYYNDDRFVRRNVFASNLGIVAKSGKDNSYFVAVTDLVNTSPVSGAKVEFYDYQQQVLRTGQTNSEGLVQESLDKKPYFVIVTAANQKGYLRLDDGNSLSLSQFDVAGSETQKGMKGFLYGERGVWRPGDSVYLHFILEDQTGELPNNYPVTFELVDPRGQTQESRVSTENINRIYPLHFATQSDDPTGNWIARVKAGGASFSKVLMIETVKPNRLEVELSFGKDVLTATDNPLSGNILVKWLHGAPANNLQTKVEVSLKAANTSFDKFRSFEFDDPARPVGTDSKPIFDGQVNEQGAASFQTALTNTKLLPGKLIAKFKSRAFETGGDFSTNFYSIPYHPFTAYAGVELPEDRNGQKRLTVDQNSSVSFAAVDPDGRPLGGRSLSVGLYRVQWRWWWDRGEDNISRYNSGNHYDALQKTTVTTNNQGVAQWNVNVPRWGRYLVRVCDNESGHCSGDFFYAGYPWYGDENNYREAAAMLSFTADKEKYEVGETVNLTVPTGKVGRALVTIESGTKVIESFWTNAQDGENTISFKTTPEMTPTVYAHVSLIQPHGQVENDLPIRLYGVIPVSVEDPSTKLEPQISMPDELRPEQQVTIEVSEAEGKAMAYSLAVVDKGLLGLTNFKTPNPWNAFYAREALGVRTWDVYDHVLGAYGGDLERLLSIGGDGEIERGESEDDVNRFKPVVMHLGPFQLKKGRKAKHKITLPNYVGEVRTMVVAANERAYGAAEKNTPVRQPLMLLATLPRVLGPGETVRLPVTVFAMDAKVRNVKVSLKENNDMAGILAQTTQSVSFDRPGEKVIYFDVLLPEKTGAAQFVVEASGNGEKASQTVDILVRNPNPYITNVTSKVLQPGQSWETDFSFPGMQGTNTGILEVSNIPPIDLGKRLNYLLRYPYGCVEQTLSGGFPQLYVNKLMELDAAQEEKAQRNIRATIERLKLFQTSRGGFGYWPGDGSPNLWSTNYAGHFLLEARDLGYAVPNALVKRWIQFQKNNSKTWSPQLAETGYAYSKRWNELTQAYRLYTLALANEPDLSAMNRLREINNLEPQARWRLAAAYALAGKPEVARSLTANLSVNVSPYTELSHTYGSSLRDQAMILETLVLLDEKDRSAGLLKDIAEQLSNRSWYSTQTVSYCLLSIGKYVGGTEIGNDFKFVYRLDGARSVNAGSKRPVFQIKIPADKSGNRALSVNNPGKGTLFTRLILTGQPVAGEETAASNDLNINVSYRNMKGQPLDPVNIVQGTDFIAEVRITHPGKRQIPYEEMALAQIFPSGWEIINSRLDGFEAFADTNQAEYRDFRDDRVHTFFDIGQRKSQVYRVQLNAAYEGRYYLPAVSCEAMYDNSINARVPGQWVQVVRPGEL